MHEFDVLQDLVIITAVGVVVVSLLRRLGLPSIAGFIISGALIGPHALGLIDDAHAVELLAEVGVVLLLFGIGLELSLDRLKRLWQPILIGGALQVGLTTAAAAALAMAFGVEWRQALFLGLVVAVSSTAIVLRGLEARGELDAPHGRLALGILVFQDLCVVPMILAIPLLAGGGGGAVDGLMALLRAAGVLVGVMVAARLLVPRLLHIVARTRQRDLFVLTVLLVCVGTAFIVSTAGISLALGAFLGGLVVAGSQYRHQAMGELIPFREVFASLFFVSVGMLLDPAELLSRAGPVLGLLAALVVGKALLVFVASMAMRLPLRVGLLSAMALAQVGEFSFVLIRAAIDTPLVQGSLIESLTLAVILSMLVTPLFITLGPHLVGAVGRVGAVTNRLGVTTADEVAQDRHLEHHVILAGYGLVGRELAGALQAGGVPFVVVDLNATNIRAASELGTACYGDASNPEVLNHLNVSSARELVVAINDPTAVERTVRQARATAPDLPILVRTRYKSDIEPLRAAGASRVVVEEIEGAAAIATTLLRRHQVDEQVIEEQLCRLHRHRLEANGSAGELPGTPDECTLRDDDDDGEEDRRTAR